MLGHPEREGAPAPVPMEAPPRPLASAAASTALFAFGAVLGLHYARMGFMPLDQSIVFDGGWRTLSGQIPFRDYHTPSAIVPSLVTGAWFGLFGVTWLSYCALAAALNGLGVLLVRAILSALGLGPALASLYGALTGVVLFPPVGTPFMDNVSFFLSLLALALATRGGGDGARAWPLLLAPGAVLAGCLSKQIPAALVAPLVVLLACRAGARRIPRALGQLALGAGLALAVLALALAVLRVDLESARLWFFVTPSEEGARRARFLPDLAAFLRRAQKLVGDVDLWTLVLLGLGAPVLGLLGLAQAFAREEGRRLAARERALAALLALGLAAACLLFIVYTGNQPEIGLGFVFLAAGLLQLSLSPPRRSSTRPDLPRRRGLLHGAFALLFALVAVRDAWTFDLRHNRTRSANDLVFDAELARRSAPDLPAGLRFLRWSVPPMVRYTAADMRDLVAHLAEAPGDCILFGDTSVIYGLAGKPSTMPSLWWHPRLTIPLPSEPRFPLYEDLVLAAFERYDIRRVVIEGEESWSRRRYEHFERVVRLVEQRTLGERSFGPFRVIELAPR